MTLWSVYRSMDQRINTLRDLVTTDRGGRGVTLHEDGLVLYFSAHSETIKSGNKRVIPLNT